MAKITQLSSFLFGYCLFQVTWSLSWKTKPQSQSAPLGGRVTFRCEIENLGDNDVVWQDSTNMILFIRANRFNAPPRYTIEGQYNLVISDITKDDNKNFICNVKDLGLASANLTVLLPPDPPTISLNPSASIHRENQELVLTCGSRGGNPNPTINWLKNGQVLVDNIDYTPAPSIGGLSQSELTVVLDRTDHQANYTCVVFNAANAQNPLSTFRELRVQYSPYVTFSPYNPLNVRLGQDAEFFCNVDANPPVNVVTWYKDGIRTTETSTKRVFQPAIESDTGAYTCVANNNIGSPRNSTLVFTVMYPPKITIPNDVSVSEYERFTLPCAIKANPEPYEVHWERVGNGQPLISDRDLVFDRIRREDAGNYTCKAWSQLKISGEQAQNVLEQAYTFINVEYAPGNGFIKPVGEYNVGETVELKCSASPEGYPRATYEWKKDNRVMAQNDGTYRINSANLSDIGEYVCQPFNKMGRGQESRIFLSINEPPKLIDSPNADIYVLLSDDQLLQVQCIARGRPSPTITWFKNNDDVPLTTLYSDLFEIYQTNQTVEEYSYQITSILFFRGPGRNRTRDQRTQLRVDDIGNYTCRVDSPTTTDAVLGKAAVYVQFPPQVTSGPDREAVNIGQKAFLPCVTHANPDPTFTWYRNNVQITDGGRFLTRVEKLDNAAKFQSTLAITNVVDADLGEYSCNITNTLGAVRKAVRLSVRSSPEPPQYLQYRGKTWESVSLSWIAGFDGGSDQDFYVQYSVGEIVNEVKVTPQAATSFNVTKLTPHTSYLFFVYGQNDIGKGRLSNGTLVKTEELIIPPLGTTPLFDAATKVLDVKVVLQPMYCLRIDLQTSQTGSRWETMYPCLEMINEIIDIPQAGVSAMNLSVCLRYRNDVCGAPTMVEINKPSQGLTERDVIIIACVCAVIIITLLTILVCFICKRKRNQAKEHQAENSARRAQPINGSITSPHKQPQGYDNTDGPLELKRNGHIPNHGPPLRQNGSVPHDTSYDSQTEKQIYENEMNRRNENNSKGPRPGELQFHGVPRSQSKDKYVDLEDKQDPSLQGIESGYSTPDPNKPKKPRRRTKLTPLKNDIYYSDFARFEHDPPGHTCGLPCCREDADLHLKQTRPNAYSCMPATHEILDANFTLRQKRHALLSGRPTFCNKFYSLQNISSDEIARQRKPIPDFNELFEGPKKPKIILTDSLENPFIILARPGLRKGEFMCRREMCLPDSPEHKPQFVFSDDLGESLDFDNEEEHIIEYYTNTPQNGVKVSTASVKIIKGDIAKNGCHDNEAFCHDDASSTDHYYDVVNVIESSHNTQSPQNRPTPRLYPDISHLQEEVYLENEQEGNLPSQDFSAFKRKYVNTLARKKHDLHVLKEKATEKFDTYPTRKPVPVSEPEETTEGNQYHLWNRCDNSDNVYEDIDQLSQRKGNNGSQTPGEEAGQNMNRFGTFGYKPQTNDAENTDKESKRHDSLKDSPITLIL